MTIQLEVPDRLSPEEQREILERLAISMNEEISPQRRTFLGEASEHFSD